MTKFNETKIRHVAASATDALEYIAASHGGLTQEEYEVAFIVAIKTWQRRFSGDSPNYKHWFTDIEKSFDQFIEEVSAVGEK